MSIKIKNNNNNLINIVKIFKLIIKKYINNIKNKKSFLSLIYIILKNNNKIKKKLNIIIGKEKMLIKYNFDKKN